MSALPITNLPPENTISAKEGGHTWTFSKPVEWIDLGGHIVVSNSQFDIIAVVDGPGGFNIKSFQPADHDYSNVAWTYYSNYYTQAAVDRPWIVGHSPDLFERGYFVGVVYGLVMGLALAVVLSHSWARFKQWRKK